MDAVHHGLSLHSFNAQALLGERELLWDSGVYGGYLFFAEAQGEFASPLSILCALLFESEYGIDVFHLLGGGYGHWPDCASLWPTALLAMMLCLLGMRLFCKRSGEMVDEL